VKLKLITLPSKFEQLPALEFAIGRVFHVTTIPNLKAIRRGGAILPGKQSAANSPFGENSQAYFRSRDCVSFFDYRSLSEEQLAQSLDKCSPLMATLRAPAAFLFLAPHAYGQLIPWTAFHADGSFSELVIPYVEAGIRNGIPLSAIAHVAIVRRRLNPFVQALFGGMNG
jgi:hypothetical protein